MSTTQKPAESRPRETVQVLTFGIGNQEYCIELEYVTEIIDGGKMTVVPNTADHVEGIMDLRGQTTTIIDPLVLLDGASIDPDELLTDGGGNTNRVIMLDKQLVDGSGAIGWLVSTVSAVAEIPLDTLEAEGITDSPLYKGVSKRDDSDEFLIWLDPEAMTE
ncbi:chemotaxis protein CheW [Salinibaculum rarum]|uniref:chemotaxis protein CheW n=1 Tax=Salinibaculum rarum TaxID=3058903 RepID=UPI00265F9580|nr:chemotaxis protein CheW [Salinibaculum sp. KK48]